MTELEQKLLKDLEEANKEIGKLKERCNNFHQRAQRL